MALLTLLTDFGVEDYYVAAVKGTVLRLAPGIPGTQIVDVSHEVPPGDVATGAFLLAAAVPWFPAGTVHLAVVDPGVGSGRRILAAQTSSAWLVLPDNGLLTHVLHKGAIQSVRSVERSDLFLPGPGQTFHGRDRFAPVAAWLLRGSSEEGLGPEVGDPVRLPFEPPRRENGQLHGQVIHIDRYGNLITDIPSEWRSCCPQNGLRIGGSTSFAAAVGARSGCEKSWAPTSSRPHALAAKCVVLTPRHVTDGVVKSVLDSGNESDTCRLYVRRCTK
jgi:S-adenosyl-L-methionine hydrolase (adenosine-forming)